LTVARHMNISAAAKSMYISQPTISKVLQRFESGIGMKVFVRSNRGLKLTPQGEILFSTLEPLFYGFDRAIEAAKAFGPDPDSILRIVAPSSYDAVEDYKPLKRYVREYVEKYPEVVLSEQLNDFKELRRQLEFGEADLAFSQDFAVSDIPGIRFKRISEYKMYLTMSVRHPLAVYETPPPEELSKLTFFSVPHASEAVIKNNIINKGRECGFTPKNIELLDNFPTLLHMLNECRGVCICARFDNSVSAELKYYELAPGNTPSYVVVAWLAERLTERARKFIEMLPD
jgi:DNA-binding transcriptional LysR family regulator